ncbi:MAG: hypothetical protein LBG45_01640 [Dysgonamonadaceae bacterium]|jgi:hypothetical protein|nr:hypothetical protein [Dysgonamonadaceae bacterium]
MDKIPAADFSWNESDINKQSQVEVPEIAPLSEVVPKRIVVEYDIAKNIENISPQIKTDIE